MEKTRLVIVSGMSGVGKSTTAQQLAKICTENQVNHTWYHEEMDEHPIRWVDGGEFTVGPLTSHKGMKANIEDIFHRWRRLIKRIQSQGGMHLMEGCLYQSIIRYFFNSPLCRGEIIDYYQQLMNIIEPVNPHIIFLYRPNVKDSFEKAFKIRGERWKNIILDSKDEPYFKKHEYIGDESVFEMEKDYQDLAHYIFDQYQGAKLSIDTSKESWDDYLKSISDFLNLDYIPREKIEITDLKKYCGKFEFKDQNNLVHSIDVVEEDENLYTRFSWFKYVEMNLIDNDTFELLSFPIFFKYHFNQSQTMIDISGNYGWDIMGKTLVKTSHIK